LAKARKGVMPAALKKYWANKRKTGTAPKGMPKALRAYHMRKKGGK
jgi:hypothetical protein